MRSRDVLVLVGAVILLLGIGLVVLAPPSAASEIPPPAPPGDAPGRTNEPPAEVVAVDGGPAHPTAAIVADPVFRKSSGVDTTGWTSGEVRGDIQLSTAVLDRIESISVYIEELREAVSEDGTVSRPFSRVMPVERGIGTPTFVIRDIPFSRYGYVVGVHSPGLNGSRHTGVQITKEHPLADDLKLAITPGVPFSVLLRDQERAAVTRTEVRLVPRGAPLGRPALDGTTDLFGSAVFENVLSGDYLVLVGPAGQPLVEPVAATVQPGGRVFGGNTVQAQGLTVTVPRGQPVSIFVQDVGRYQVAGVRVKLQKTDAQVLMVLEGTTDVAGRVQFPHVQPGVWAIDVQKEDHQPGYRQIHVKEGEATPEQSFTLTRLR
jgi:hypothetical protein